MSKLLQDVVGELSKLPGVGRRTALRLAIHILRMERESVAEMTESIDRFRNDVKYCAECNNLSDEEVCPICLDDERDRTTICVVEQVADVLSIENTHQYKGLYHVLGGVISPMQGISPSDLKIDLLTERIARGGVKEVILAISTSVEGETTLFYLMNRLRQFPGVKVTSIARGIGFGDELEYVDELTITHALRNRREVRKMKRGIMTLAALAAMLWSLPAAAQEEYRQPALENPESWSVVVIPDLQGYAKNEASQPIARLMTAWIADNIERLNVRMVLCVGDVVEQNDRIGNGFSGDLTSVRQWQGMADAFDVLDGRVPYLVATGNHDYTYTRSGARRTHLNEYFPIGRNPLNAAAICQFGLDSDENPAVENCAFELKAPDGKDYLFLNMEFAPRDTVMKWAQQVAGLEEYADHRIVLMTHAYLDAKDQRLSGPCKVTSYEPLVRNGRIVKIKGLPLPDASNGEELWQKLVRPASNIELVVCGHISGSGFRTDRNSAGKDVHQMLFDAQSMGGGYEGNGGDGWIRILEFMPDGVTVKATTFSPLFAISPTTRQFAWMRDAKNEFTFRFSK